MKDEERGGEGATAVASALTTIACGQAHTQFTPLDERVEGFSF